jgi:hypothetical protein
MTESEWEICDNPSQMVEFLRGKISDRKFRHVACAFVRQVWHLLTNEQCRKAVELAEQYAEGEATDQEMADMLSSIVTLRRQTIFARCCCSETAVLAVGELVDILPSYGVSLVELARIIRDIVRYPSRLAALCGYREFSCGFCRGTGKAYAVDAILPGRIPVNPRLADCICCCGTGMQDHAKESPCSLCVLIRSSEVTSLALAACQRRIDDTHLDSFRLCLVADALEEAGCDEQLLLTHLRSAGPHYLGCWALDLAMDKE